MERTFWNELWIARWSLLQAFGVTVEVAVMVILVGTALGLIGGLVLVYGYRPFRWLIRAYVDIIRGIPVLVLILFFYYGLAMFKINIPPMWAGIISLGAFCAAHMSETIRGAIQSIPVSQSEAGKAIGLRFGQRLLYVILPQALRRVVPPWINTAVEMVKGTTLLSIIGVIELLLATQQSVARNYLILEFYFFLIVLYFVINFTLSQLGAMFERRFAYLKY